MDAGSATLEASVRELMPFQGKAVDEIAYHLERHKRRYALIAGDTGLGKTATAIRAMERVWHLVNRNQISVTSPVILVITDAAVKFNWAEEIQRWALETPELSDILVIDGNEYERMGQIVRLESKRPKWVITNFDTVRLDLPLFQDFFSDPENNIIVLDEADRIQNMESMRSIAIRSLEAAYKLAMTATPVANRADTLYPILQFLNPGAPQVRERKWGSLGRIPIRYHINSPEWGSEDDFVGSYCTFNAWGKVNGSKNLPDLHRRLTNFGMIRWLKRELADLPPIVYETIIEDGTPGQREWYNRMAEGFIDYMENDGKAAWSAARNDPTAQSIESNNILAHLTHLRRATTIPPAIQWRHFMSTKFPDFKFDSQGIELDEVSGKSMWLKEYALQQFGEYGDLPEYGGIFAWSQWTDMTDFLYDEMGQFNTRVGLLKLDGSASSMRRYEIQRAVQGGRCKMLISSEAGGRGINFQRLDTAVLMDLPWSPNKVDQAVGRVDRIGQKAEQVTVISVLMRNTIDTKRMLKVIHQKQADANEILDGKRGGKSKSALDFRDPDEVLSWV